MPAQSASNADIEVLDVFGDADHTSTKTKQALCIQNMWPIRADAYPRYGRKCPFSARAHPAAVREGDATSDTCIPSDIVSLSVGFVADKEAAEGTTVEDGLNGLKRSHCCGLGVMFVSGVV